MRLIVLACLAAILSACASTHQAPKATCAGNPYLQKYDCSISAMQQAAIQGDADAQYALGYMYYYGVDTTVDKSAAAIWIHKAAVAGQPLALQAQRMIDKQSVPGAGNAVMIGKTAKVKPKQHFTARQLKKHTATQAKMAHMLSAEQKKYNKYAATQVAKHSPRSYVLQLMASPNLTDVTTMLHTYGFSNSYVYTKEQGGKLWNVLVYGSYPTRSAAVKAIASLPPALQKLAPWPVRLTSIMQQLHKV